MCFACVRSSTPLVCAMVTKQDSLSGVPKTAPSIAESWTRVISRMNDVTGPSPNDSCRSFSRTRREPCPTPVTVVPVGLVAARSARRNEAITSHGRDEGSCYASRKRTAFSGRFHFLFRFALIPFVIAFSWYLTSHQPSRGWERLRRARTKEQGLGTVVSANAAILSGVGFYVALKICEHQKTNVAEGERRSVPRLHCLRASLRHAA